MGFSKRENWWEGGGGDYAGFKGMRMSELTQKSRPGEWGEAYFLSLSYSGTSIWQNSI